jgi:hypothetical protein
MGAEGGGCNREGEVRRGRCRLGRLLCGFVYSGGVCGGVDGMAGLVVVDQVTLIWGRACWGISLLGGMTRLQG